MRLLSIELQNVGPFETAAVEFLATPEQTPAVTLITGENGTGKSILLDAIRAAFGPAYAKLERTIWQSGRPPKIQLAMALGGQPFAQVLKLNDPTGHFFRTNGLSIDGYERSFVDLLLLAAQGKGPPWVADFWRSTLATDSYSIQTLVKPDPQRYLEGALQGTQRNAEVTELLVYFDYLRDSRNKKEKEAGEALYAAAERIIQASLLDGEFLGIERTTFTPRVRQAGQEVPLANVSSGNAYLIQRMISLLGKMYAVQVLRGSPPADLCQTPGLLLIDEAENHFHPRWQKRFLRDVLSVFPRLQIIATTHSPFILASVPGARVYVCRWAGRTCTITEETEAYANQPVDEILLSEAFDNTQPFGAEITLLLERRRQSIDSGDEAARHQIEAQLKEHNPEYFSYLDIDEKLRALGVKD